MPDTGSSYRRIPSSGIWHPGSGIRAGPAIMSPETAVAHHTVKQGYLDLVERINRYPQGAPPSELLYRILEMLFSEREAELVADLPVRPFTAERAARAWKMPVDEARVVLDELASRAILVDIESEDACRALPPVHQCGRGFRQGSFHGRRDPARSSLRVRVLSASGLRASRPRLRACEPCGRERQPHRRRRLLLPPQDGAPGPRVLGADEHLHDLQQHRRLAHPARVRTLSSTRSTPPTFFPKTTPRSARAAENAWPRARWKP